MGRVIFFSSLCGLSGAFLFHTLIQWWEKEKTLRQLGAASQLNKALEWIHRRKHQAQRVKDFPDFLDLFLLALSSGYSFAGAFQKAVQVMPSSILKSDLQKTCREWEQGSPLPDALLNLSKRLRDPRINRIPPLMVQCLKTGSSLENILKDLSSSLRAEQFLSMERQAQTASLKLLFPIFVFLLPAVFLILLGPLIIQIAQKGSLF